ncbi:hypothetical protein TPB0596_01120 [Tsukamurella pulmonis]|uniref:hypothetical protein n=1 Tax=Tsukamurella pulmonis TaxID=47312 RepID=UPI001EDF9E28|nr:hypothetical protein [Tsukamurella pulmonis]BDD80349.1 hypothetical protein TPB0596_01120 [Tsukamurella pulmonis]
MNVAGFLRWALTKPAIILLVIVAGIAGGAIGWKSTTSHFESSAAVLVIPPGAGSVNAKDNPFTSLDYGAAQIAQVLTVVAQSPRGAAALEGAGASPDVTMIAAVGDGNPKQISPLITFTVSAPTAEQSKAGADALIAFWRAEFKKMQVDAGVVGNTFADLRVPVTPTTGMEVGGNPMRAALGLAMGAALATLVLCLIAAAGWETYRRNKGAAGSVSSPAADGPATPASTPVDAASAQPGIAATMPAAASGGAATSGVAASPGAPVGALGADAAAAPSRVVPAAIPIRPPGDAARRAMTRWRDRVEEVSEDGEIPLPELDETSDASPATATADATDDAQDASPAATTGTPATPAAAEAEDEDDDELEVRQVQSAR